MVSKSCLFLLAAVWAATVEVYGQSDLPIVQTAHGKIQGIVRRRSSGKIYLQFYGVPYAKSPTGERRFAPPERLTNWPGIWVANTTYECIQVDHRDPPQSGHTKGTEDCLFLDIYVPGDKVNPTANFDVIVHIHGGGFMFGSCSEYAIATPFMSKDVLFISINHRLGIFGFLSLEDEVLPGNNGMRDQVMALQWIQENIKWFGGNPDSVTLTGLSAGGSSVHFHMMSPLSKGLFHKGISVSGNALDPWAIHEEPRQKAERVGNAVGCPHKGDSKAFLACLRSRPPHQLIETTKLFREWIYYPFSPFALVVDSAAKEPFLPEQPYKLLVEKKVQDIPWIISLTTSEGLYPLAQLRLREDYLGIMAKNIKRYLPLALHLNYTVRQDQKNEVTQKIMKEYLGDKPLDNSTYNDFVKIGSDRLFAVGMMQSVRLQVKAMKSPVYFHIYNYTSEKVWTVPEMHFGIKKRYGVSHGDNMLLMFEAPMKHSKNDTAIQSILVDLWATFAKTGKTGYDDWKRFNESAKENSIFYIESPTIVDVRMTEDHSNQQFWESLPIMENKRLVDAQAANDVYD